MGKATKLGIWMDHTSAHLMEFTTDPILTTTIELGNHQARKEHGFGQNELMMHHKQQRQQSDYYKKLSDVIKKYDHVLLFGPTEAKNELQNLLSNDHHFSKIKITVKSADKMTEHQQHAFVKDYFSKLIIKI